MNATRVGKWAKRAVWLTLAAVMTIGCNPLQTAAFIFHKDDKVPAKYPLRPKEKDNPKHDKDVELKVLILCDQRQGLPLDFAGTDRELAAVLTRVLPELAQANKDKITVVPAAQVAKYQAGHPDWRHKNGVEIGKALGADCVLQVYLAHASLFQAGTRDQLYDGRAEVEVNVYDVAVGKGSEQHYLHPFAYRPNQSPDRDQINPAAYKQGFLERLAVEIAWKHVEHPMSDGIAE